IILNYRWALLASNPLVEKRWLQWRPTEAMTAFLKFEDPRLKNYALFGLAQIGNIGSLKTLLELAKTDPAIQDRLKAFDLSGDQWQKTDQIRYLEILTGVDHPTAWDNLV